MIPRFITEQIKNRFHKGRAVILYGPRQSGKTTLIDDILSQFRESDVLHLNADEPDVRELLSDASSSRLRTIIANRKFVFIDEAQRVRNIGLTLKLIIDEIQEPQVIASGSSAFELASEIKEPLTGRKYEFYLFPLSFMEMVNHTDLLTETRLVERRIIFGYYPEVVTHPHDSRVLLRELVSSYLYKDLLTLEQIKKPVLLERIVRALALQVGSEISFHEIAQLVGSNYHTVAKYVDLLEKAYVLFTLPALSRNVRNEIKKGRKIYFYDNGVLNSVLGNYNLVPSRSDIGPLWENFIISERIKMLSYTQSDIRGYFWRTTQQQEIDYIEESSEGFSAYEIKWRKTAKPKISKTFDRAYNLQKAGVIHLDNFEDFLLEKYGTTS